MSRGKAWEIFTIAMFVAVTAFGEEGVNKWRTPEGSLWFGTRPPPGSVPLGSVGKLETLDPDDLPEPTPNARAVDTEREAAEILRRRSQRRQQEKERRQSLANAVRVGPHAVIRGRMHWIISGVVRNSAAESVHDVRVGSAGTWVATDPTVIPARSEATFRLEVPLYPFAADDVLPPLEVRWREQ